MLEAPIVITYKHRSRHFSSCRNWLKTMTSKKNIIFTAGYIKGLHFAHTYNDDHLGDGFNKVLIWLRTLSLMEEYGNLSITSPPKAKIRTLLAVSESMPRAWKYSSWLCSRSLIAAPWEHLTSSATIWRFGLTFTVARGSSRRLLVNCPASVCWAYLHENSVLLIKSAYVIKYNT